MPLDTTAEDIFILKAHLPDKTSSYETASNIIEHDDVRGAHKTTLKWLIRHL